jgi:hypothetical protein
MYRALESGAIALETLAETASRHRVSPSLARALHEAGMAARLPEEFRDYCTVLAEINDERNAALATLAREIGEVLRAAGVDAVLLKGGASLFDPALPHRSERFLLDLDLLVGSAQLEAAETALLDAGWYRLPETGGDGHQLPTLGRPGAPAAIDLHFALLSPPHEALLPPAEVLAAAIPGQDALPLKLPTAHHRLIHNVAHAQLADSSLAFGQLELRQLLEFAALARQVTEPRAWSDTYERFARHRALLALEVQMLAAKELFDLPLPLPLRRLSPARALLARALWLESHPRVASWSDRSLRPVVQLARSLRQPALRRRFWRNLRSPAWRRRQLAMLRKRRA